MHILFVDDDLDICRLFQVVLGLEGVVTDTCANGREAVAAVESGLTRFDAIVLDVEMPIMDGWTALNTLRRLPQAQSVPIVLLTGHSHPQHKARALQAGADELVNKPLLPSQLIGVLRHLVPM